MEKKMETHKEIDHLRLAENCSAESSLKYWVT